MLSKSGMIVPLLEDGSMDDTAEEGLGPQLRQRRKALGLTQDELADLAGCSPRFVRALEAGKATVRLDKVVDILDALGLELSTRLRQVS